MRIAWRRRPRAWDFGGGVEAGALEHELNAVVRNPLEVAGVALGVDRVFLAVNDDGGIGGLDIDRGAVDVLEDAACCRT